MSTYSGLRAAIALVLGASAVSLGAPSIEPALAAHQSSGPWRPAGAEPLSDDDAAELVRPAAEYRSANADPNYYRPTAAELEEFRHGQTDRYRRDAVQYNPLTNYVTGGFSGTTDEILQWAAHKWGIPEDVVRAVATTESWWRMSQLGDPGWTTDPDRYPWYSRVLGSREVFRSLGIMQVKWTPEGLHLGTEPLRWRSTAFNVDYWSSVVRYYYDGRCDWCGPDYQAGEEWASVGAWYSPWPWNSSDDYVSTVQRHVAERTWTHGNFR